MTKTDRPNELTSYLQQQNTPESRFTLAAIVVVGRHGGRPTATIEGGRIVFAYPDGTRTIDGKAVYS